MNDRQPDLFDASELARKGPAPSPAAVPAAPGLPARVTLDAVWPLYRTHLEAAYRSPHTVRQYLANLVKFRSYLQTRELATQPLQFLRLPDLEGYVASLKEAQKGYADKTIALAITALKTFFRWLKEDTGILQANPAEKVQPHRALLKLPPILTLAEYEALLRLASPDPELYCLIALFVEGCLKKDELLRLTPRDFDFRNKYGAALSVKNKDRRKNRKVALPDPGLAAALRDLLARLKKQDPRFHARTLIFDYEPAYVNKKLKAFVARNGLKIFSETKPQNLRHFGARKYLEAHNLEELRRHLGLAPWDECPELFRLYDALKAESL